MDLFHRFEYRNTLERIFVASEKCTLSGLDTCSPKPESVSSSILEEHHVENLGTFTAYEDGRVRVRFTDRTLLNMDATHTLCSLILPNGHCIKVATEQPVGVEQYVEPVTEFIMWAFQSPAERGRVIQLREHIQLAAEKCSLAATLCDWALSKKPPATTSAGIAKSIAPYT